MIETELEQRLERHVAAAGPEAELVVRQDDQIAWSAWIASPSTSDGGIVVEGGFIHFSSEGAASRVEALENLLFTCEH